MNCEELTQLLPDLVDGTLAPDLLAAAQAALEECPDCRQELEVARQIRSFLVTLQSENTSFRVPAGFETRLLARIHQQHGRLELLDLSSKTFVLWLAELIDLIGGLLDPAAQSGAGRREMAGA